ncbi:hypothetical protein [Solicola sp. PLA-1-18]|uniref:hypothetical protein n=1 Tax=Solicola sp. PLA-1-18 TaxID=3380532 RepID=UPI003B78BD55
MNVAAPTVCLLVLAVAGCSTSTRDDESTTPQPAPRTTTPPSGAGDFFTWEQDSTMASSVADAMLTTRAQQFYSELGLRYGGHVDPAWDSIEDSDLLEFPRSGEADGVLYRGPVRYRLMDVVADGDTATVSFCQDLSRVEKRRFDDDTWTTAYPEPVARGARELTRSGGSPTGWTINGAPSSGLTYPQCEAALASPAAEVLSGRPELRATR